MCACTCTKNVQCVPLTRSPKQDHTLVGRSQKILAKLVSAVLSRVASRAWTTESQTVPRRTREGGLGGAALTRRPPRLRGNPPLRMHLEAPSPAKWHNCATAKTFLHACAYAFLMCSHTEPMRQGCGGCVSCCLAYMCVRRLAHCHTSPRQMFVSGHDACGIYSPELPGPGRLCPGKHTFFFTFFFLDRDFISFTVGRGSTPTTQSRRPAAPHPRQTRVHGHYGAPKQTCTHPIRYVLVPALLGSQWGAPCHGRLKNRCLAVR